MDRLPVYLQKPIFEKLFNIAEYTNLTKEERDIYDSSLKYKWYNKNVIDYAKEKGREEGRGEGAHEKAIFIALEMKKENFPFAQIAKFTGLPIEEVEKL